MNPVSSTTLPRPARAIPTEAVAPKAPQAVPADAGSRGAILELPMPSRQRQPVSGRQVVGAIALMIIALSILGLFVGLPLAVAAHAVFHTVAMNIIIAAAVLLEAFAVVVFLILRTRGSSWAPHSA